MASTRRLSHIHGHLLQGAGCSSEEATAADAFCAELLAAANGIDDMLFTDEGQPLNQSGAVLRATNETPTPVHSVVGIAGDHPPSYGRGRRSSAAPLQYIRLEVSDGRVPPFYCIWQPARATSPATPSPASTGLPQDQQRMEDRSGQTLRPLLIHTPGYAGLLTAHPELADAGYNVLHINPLGYSTPTGPDGSKKVALSSSVVEELERARTAAGRGGGTSAAGSPQSSGDPGELDPYADLSRGINPVLLDTIRTGGDAGYRDWLLSCLIAIRWGMGQPGVDPERIAFFGGSQGGGGSLLLASILSGKGVVKAVAADQPFLTDIPNGLRQWDRAHPITAEVAHLMSPGGEVGRDEAALRLAWKGLGLVDTLNHSHRLTMPTLLTAGAKDGSCPPSCVFNLFSRLPGTRSLTEEAGKGHDESVVFSRLALAWFQTHV